jgi:nucleoside-diphosphate-sugar epimerase
MEVIIAGATGYVGSTVLDNCIADPTIAKIYVLTRRPLEPSVTDNDMKKVEVIIHTDWLNYEPTLLKRLANVRACLWYSYFLTK